jgi:hypothetical protein
MVSLGIGAFALVGILAIGLSGGDGARDSDEAAAVERMDEGSGDESSVREERIGRGDSERAAADDERDEAWEEWVEGPASEAEDTDSADEGEDIAEGEGDSDSGSDSADRGGDDETGEEGPDSE